MKTFKTSTLMFSFPKRLMININFKSNYSTGLIVAVPLHTGNDANPKIVHMSPSGCAIHLPMLLELSEEVRQTVVELILVTKMSVTTITENNFFIILKFKNHQHHCWML